MTLLLVLGGARSGKSRYAEALVSQAAPGEPVTYVATAGPPRDAEMARRIEAHRARRPAAWRTLEVEHDLAGAVRGTAGIVLVDCLTLWLSNRMLAGAEVVETVDHLLAALHRRTGRVVLVSNEVGEGIVPATPLGRAFRDAQGMLNQRVAAAADAVVLMVAGCPVTVKPRQDPEVIL